MVELKRDIAPAHLWFTDDIFGLDPDWIDDFADAVVERDARIPFTMQSRVNLITDAHAAALGARRREGSLARRRIRARRRSSTRWTRAPLVGAARTATRLLREHGIRVCWFLQLGYPSEEWDDIIATRDLDPRRGAGRNRRFGRLSAARHRLLRPGCAPSSASSATGATRASSRCCSRARSRPALYRRVRDALHREVRDRHRGPRSVGGNRRNAQRPPLAEPSRLGRRTLMRAERRPLAGRSGIRRHRRHFDERFGSLAKRRPPSAAPSAPNCRGVRPDRSVLEIGGGTGDDAAWLARAAATCFSPTSRPPWSAEAQAKFIGRAGLSAEVAGAGELGQLGLEEASFRWRLLQFRRAQLCRAARTLSRADLARLVDPAELLVLVLFGTCCPGEMDRRSVARPLLRDVSPLHAGTAPARLGGNHFNVRYHRRRRAEDSNGTLVRSRRRERDRRVCAAERRRALDQRPSAPASALSKRSTGGFRRRSRPWATTSSPFCPPRGLLNRCSIRA